MADTDMEDSVDMNTTGFEVRVINSVKGKGLFATRPFKTGDVIFEERPLVCCQFAWNSAYGYLACDFCMKPLETAEENARRLTGKLDLILPYREYCDTRKENHIECCECGTSYCSEQCRNQAWKQFHKTLCPRTFIPDPAAPLEQLQETWKSLHYPPETACIMLLARMIATVRQATDQEGAMHLFMQFCHCTTNENEEIAHKLLGVKFSTMLEKLRELVCQALYEEDVHAWLTPEGFRSLVALVGRNGQGVGTSPISVWVKNCSSLDISEEERNQLNKFIDQLYDSLEKEAGCFLNCEGSALYPLQSSCNHSCEPNAMPSFPFNNFHLLMSATKDIRPGDEICVSYLDECNLNRSRHSRVKFLRENYLFTCHCPKCESQTEEPDMTSEEEIDEEEEEEMENEGL